MDQMTHEELADESSLKLYCGFDPTSDSLQLGNYAMITMLKRFQVAGHKPYILVVGRRE